MRQLHDMDKPILLLLTQSDAYDYDVDDDGEEISILVPKSEKDRKDQENYMLETLREQGMEDVLKYADILTVSALLATEAIKNNDEEMFEQIKGMLAESFGLDPETIQSESRLEADLGINSLELAELALRCDEEFGVDIDEDDIHRLITVGDVAAYIEEKKA